MERKVVSFSSYAQLRRARLKEKVLHGIDYEELAGYYERVIKDCIRHLSFLQRFIVEECLYEVVTETFMLGTEASRALLSGKSEREMVEAFSRELEQLVQRICAKHQLFQYVSDWEGYSLTIIADDLADRWFAKGLQFGLKQRKLRLM
ncbi:hypothetical protein BSNK01_10920 [Bacillaceae bacterium]